MEDIINLKLISSSQDIKTKDDLFTLIVNLAFEDQRTSNKAKLLSDIQKREAEDSTAFENGLIIPHCRSKYINKITLVIINFNDCDFNALDGKTSNFAISILVPKNEGDKHLTILSKISRLLSKVEDLENFKKLAANDKIARINEIITDSDKLSNDNSNNKDDEKVANDGYDFVAVTSCAAGIAHTYMARDALKEAAAKLNLKCKIETRGAMTENALSEEEIIKAKYVIIAADVTINKTPFLGKKIYSCSTNEAIKNAESVISEAKEAPIQYGKGETSHHMRIGTTNKKKQNILGQAIMSGLSYMIPITITAGILIAIPNALAAGGSKHGGSWGFPNQFVAALWDFAHLGLVLMVPILAMFMAYKLGGKPAMPAALLGGYFINDGSLMAKYDIFHLLPKDLDTSVSAGFLGGLVIGIVAGFLVRWSRYIKWHKAIAPVAGLMIVPIASSFIVFCITVFVIGIPITWLMAELFKGLTALDSAGGIGAEIGVGILFATLMAIDLGGPINKTTLVVATIIFTSTLQASGGDLNQVDFIPQDGVQSAISVPPLGMWFATVVFKKKFSPIEINAGKAALPMGIVGITEGSLPFAFRTPFKAMIANMTGAAVAGGMVAAFQIRFFGGLGSPIGAWVGYAEHDGYGFLWLISVLTGAVISGTIYGLLRKKNPEYEKMYNEIKLKKWDEYHKLGVNNKRQLFKYKTKKFRKEFANKFVYCINPKHWFHKPDNSDGEL